MLRQPLMRDSKTIDRGDDNNERYHIGLRFVLIRLLR